MYLHVRRDAVRRAVLSEKADPCLNVCRIGGKVVYIRYVASEGIASVSRVRGFRFMIGK